MAEIARSAAIVQVRRTISAYRDKVHEVRNDTAYLPPEGARIVDEYCLDRNDEQTLVQDAIDESTFLEGMDDGLLLEYCAVCKELDEALGLGSWSIGSVNRIVKDDKGFWETLWGAFNTVNANLYQSRNNPVKYAALDGRNIFDDIGFAAKSAWEKTIDVANISKEAVVNTVSAGWRAITYFHFEGRDAKNIITESYTEIKDSAENGGDWTLLPDSMTIYHQNGIGEAELKFICKDGREAVFSKDYSSDGSYQLVTDPRYKGTYNYCNPASYPTLPNGIKDFKGMGNCISGSLEFIVKEVGHFFADMLPYYIVGGKNERNQ